MKKLLLSTILLFTFVAAAQAQNPSTARRVRYGTPPANCNPATGEIHSDTSVTPADEVRCKAANKWFRETLGKVNAQTGTSYTFVRSDNLKFVTFSNASAVAVTLPQATAAGDFLSGWNAPVFNLGAGTVTITPTTSTINGGATLTLATGEGAWIFSNGTNYSALKTISTAAAASIAPIHLTDANTVEQYNGTTSQVHRFYATRTSSTSYEALKTSFDSGNGAFKIEAEKGGAGGSFRRIFIVVSGGIYQFNDTSFRPPSTDVTSLGDGSNYWNQVFGNDYIARSNGKFRFAGSTRVFAPANGILNFKNDSENAGSGTFRFDPRTQTQITSDQNNYSVPVPGFFIRLSSDASRNITGLTFSPSVGDGQVHKLVNIGSNPIVLKHDDAASTAANRFYCSTGADITLNSTATAKEAADIIYDNTLQRWLVFKS